MASVESAAPQSSAIPAPTPGGFPVGGIVMWSGALVDIPGGWNLCDGTNGTPDLRAKFIKGAAVGIDPGGTGGAAAHTPAGTNSAPAFSGTALGAHNHLVQAAVTISTDSAGTPAGTNSSESSHTHSFTDGSAAVSPHLFAVDAVTGVAGTGTTGAGSSHTHTFSGSALAGHTHTLGGNVTAASAGTPAGTVSAPAFTGTSADFQPAFYEVAYIMFLG